MKILIFLISCILLAVVPLVFVLNRVYQDGLVGRLSLLGISFAAISFLLEAFVGRGFNPEPATVMLVAMFAVFICWHLWRFHRRVLRRGTWVPN